MVSKKQFKNLKSLSNYLQDNLPNLILNDAKFLSVLQNEMRDAVYEVVYKHYTPTQYQRRKDNGGLSDINTMQITEAFFEGDNFIMLFENLAKGNDTLSDEYLTDYIEEGIPDEYLTYGEGAWSEPRPFVEATYNAIKADPKPLVNALKDVFRKYGLKVR
jgi:hypothetical protein